jgi:hypothetical protein
MLHTLNTQLAPITQGEFNIQTLYQENVLILLFRTVEIYMYIFRFKLFTYYKLD